jgi:hypothetical protein
MTCMGTQPLRRQPRSRVISPNEKVLGTDLVLLSIRCQLRGLSSLLLQARTSVDLPLCSIITLPHSTSALMETTGDIPLVATARPPLSHRSGNSSSSSSIRLAKRALNHPPAVSELLFDRTSSSHAEMEKEEPTEYPTGWKLVSITLALCCAVFVTTLVSHCPSRSSDDLLTYLHRIKQLLQRLLPRSPTSSSH